MLQNATHRTFASTNGVYSCTGLTAVFLDGCATSCRVEYLCAAGIDRMAYYQGGKFACDTNQVALEELTAAKTVLEAASTNPADGQCTGYNWDDEAGNPYGGTFTAPGLTVVYQRGPLGKGENKRPPNGCWVEDLCQAAIVELDRQGSSEANDKARRHISNALESLESRTKQRVAQNVEGENKAHSEAS